MDTSYPSRPTGPQARLLRKPLSPEKDAYFVCFTAKEDARPFGTTRGRETLLNERGEALKDCWNELANLGRGLHPDAVIVTSRQVQGILMIAPDAENAPSLAVAIRLFKVLASLRLSQLSGKPSSSLWKKGYSERTITSDAELVEARKALGNLVSKGS
jgi:hypothetical protein